MLGYVGDDTWYIMCFGTRESPPCWGSSVLSPQKKLVGASEHYFVSMFPSIWESYRDFQLTHIQSDSRVPQILSVLCVWYS